MHEDDFHADYHWDLCRNSGKYPQQVRLAVRVARTRGAVWSGVWTRRRAFRVWLEGMHPIGLTQEGGYLEKLGCGGLRITGLWFSRRAKW